MNFISKFFLKKSYGIWLRRLVNKSDGYSTKQKAKVNYEILLALVGFADDKEDVIYNLCNLFNNPYSSIEDSSIFSNYCMKYAQHQRNTRDSLAKNLSLKIPDEENSLDPTALHILAGIFGIVHAPSKIELLNKLCRSIDCTKEDIIVYIKEKMREDEISYEAGWFSLQDFNESFRLNNQVLNLINNNRLSIPLYPLFLKNTYYKKMGKLY